MREVFLEGRLWDLLRRRGEWLRSDSLPAGRQHLLLLSLAACIL
jgi:hypothetical protein